MCTVLQVMRYFGHGARAVKRKDNRHIFKLTGVHLAQELADPFFFELEHTGCVCPVQQCPGGLVIGGHRVQIGRIVDLVQDFPDDGEIAQGQHIDFDQAQFLQVLHGKLCGAGVPVHPDKGCHKPDVLV